MKVALNMEPYGYSQEAIELIEQKGYNYYECTWDGLSSFELRERIEVLIVRLAKKVGTKELEMFPNLKYLLSATTGHDHLDLDSLEEKKVQLVSLRGHTDFLNSIPSTAEFTWALLQSLSRNVHNSYVDVLEGNWDRDKFRGYQLKNKKIGIIGLGRTGLKVARYARAFDMNVIYYDPYVVNDEYEKIDDLGGLLGAADIVSIHVHLNPETTELIGKKEINLLNAGSLIINTSRAGIWNEEALVQAIKDEKIAGVATDVIISELVDVKESVLWKASKDHKNILITPHLGGATWDAMWKCEKFVVSLI